MGADWGTLVWLVMTTGLRRDEVCILCWSRVAVGKIEIRSSYRLRKGVGIKKDAKTHQMRRTALDTDAKLVAIATAAAATCFTAPGPYRTLRRHV